MGKNKRAQNTLGFVMLIILVIAGLLAISRYMRNSVSGRVRAAGDSIGGGEQYDPGTPADYGHYGSGTPTSGSND